MIKHFRKNKIKKRISIMGMILFLMPCVMFADNTSVINRISVSSNSGGNTGTASTTEGKSKVEIKVNQNINGTELPPINISEESNGEPININIDRKEEGAGYQSNTSIKAEINSGDPSTQVESAQAKSDVKSEEEEKNNSNINSVEIQTEADVVEESAQNDKPNSLLSFINNAWSAFINKINSFFSKVFAKNI